MLSTQREEVQKIKTKKSSIATWNVRTLHQEGQFDLLLAELEKFNIDITGIMMWMWHFSKMDTGSSTQEEKMVSTEKVWH